MAKRKSISTPKKINDPEVIARLRRNRIVIDEWLEMKFYLLPFESFDRIKAAVMGASILLSTREKFIKDLSLSYYRKFGELPNIYRY